MTARTTCVKMEDCALMESKRTLAIVPTPVSKDPHALSVSPSPPFFCFVCRLNLKTSFRPLIF